MTPKEKAKDLFDKMFFSTRSIEVEQSKQCALIAVDEILESIDNFEIQDFYSDVKQEIENI